MNEEIIKLENQLMKPIFNIWLMLLLCIVYVGVFLIIIKYFKTKKLIRLQKEQLSRIADIDTYESKIKVAADEKIKTYYDKKLEKTEISLNNFIDDFIEDNYIERRDEILLEQLEYSPVEYRYDISSDYKVKMKELDSVEKEMIKKNSYIQGSIFDKKSIESKFEKTIIGGFNSICDNVINKVTIKNKQQQIKKINSMYEQYNESLYLASEESLKNSTMKISKKILSIKLEKLQLMYEYKLLVEEEKEILKEQRAREKEEKKLQDIIDKKLKKIHEETEKINSQKELYMERLAQEENSDAKQVILEEINKINDTLDHLNNDEKTLEEKKKLSNSGYVYVISNIGSFGENVYKIGMTRREEPLDRVKELGDASVPFLFDVHALIYSTNAYELENKLHKEFANKRVNKINQRKEFFSVSLEEIKNVVIENYNGTVDFIHTPEAIEYRESLLIDNN